jgi:asparagine synthase (glutamine-hydrolysing)
MRRRPVGRIGAVVGLEPDRAARAAAQLEGALGPGATILGAAPGVGPALVADWDTCVLGTAADQPVLDLATWRRHLDASRLSEIEGAFALIWTDAHGTLHAARDAIGERTLYYAETPGHGLVIASTLHAVLACGVVERRLDLPAVAAYLSYGYVPGTSTLVAGIRELLPGHALRREPGSAPAVRSFWQVPQRLAADDEATLTGRLRGALERAVVRRLPGDDVDVGATLSGGVDSSLVVALARRLHRGRLRTYSISFGPEYRNELAWSSLVAGHCNTLHRVIELPQDAIVAHLDETISLSSDPIGDPLTVPNALAFRAAGAEVGVVLNGEGGDPSFGGPKNLPMLLAEVFGDGANPAGDSAWSRERTYLRAHGKCFDDLPRLLAPDTHAAVADGVLERDLAGKLADPRFPHFVTRLQAMNLTLKGAHHILHKIDEVSFPFGVLPRSPLFDRAVVEAAFATPPQLKLRGSGEKHILKRAVADLLPASILDRPKSGMLVPVEAWFKGPLLPQARARLLDGLTPYELFQRPYLERLLAGKLPGLRPRHGAKIWLLVTLEAWLRGVFAAAQPAVLHSVVSSARLS